MAETRELRIPYADLTTIAVVCPQCGAEVVVNVNDPKQHRACEDNAALKCGVCSAVFDPALKGAIVRLCEWLGLLKKSGVTVTFPVPMQTPLRPT
jgi:hypothetical protein